MITHSAVSADDWATGTGWHLEESGWCSGDRCIPLAGLTRDEAGNFQTEELASATNRGTYRSDDYVSVGPEFGDLSAATSGSSLPDLILQDRQGNPVSLSSLVARRRRMVLHAWAPW